MLRGNFAPFGHFPPIKTRVSRQWLFSFLVWVLHADNIKRVFQRREILSAMDSGHEGQVVERVIDIMRANTLVCNGCSIREVVRCECVNSIYYIWIGYLQYMRFWLLIHTTWIGGISLQKYGKRAVRRCLLKM